MDALANVTTYAYSQGYLTSIRDAIGNVTSYAYQSLTGWLMSVTFPNGGVERYTYYNDGQLATLVTRNNRIRTYQYDRLKRLGSISFQIDGLDTYTYTGQKLMSVAHNSDTESFAYDTAYRVVSDTQANRGAITSAYNPDDTLASYTVTGGPTATYGYYPDGSLRAINWTPVSGEFRYEYSLPGQYQRITFPNGQTRNYSYDEQGRLLQLGNLDPVAANLATYAYGYDLNYTTGAYTMLGQRVSMTASVPAQGLSNHLTTYEYDPLYQLVKATYPNVAPFNGEVDSWSYDAIGNRLANTVNGTAQAYTYQKITGNPNNWQRLLSDGANNYTYDLDGNAASRSGTEGTFIFTWSDQDRLITITGGVAGAYNYDWQGRRYIKQVAGTSTSHLYNGLNLIQELGTSPADYLFGPGIDEPLAMSRGGQTSYYLTDALGSVTAIDNTGGAVQNSYLHDAWGQVKSQTGSLTNPFTYTSREAAEAGLSFYRARYYQP